MSFMCSHIFLNFRLFLSENGWFQLKLHVNVVLFLVVFDTDVRNDGGIVQHLVHLVLLVVQHVGIAFDMLDSEREEIVFAVLLGDFLLDNTVARIGYCICPGPGGITCLELGNPVQELLYGNPQNSMYKEGLLKKH